MENNGNSVGNSCRVIKRSLSVRRLLPRRKAQAPGREPPGPTRSPRDHVLGGKLVQPLEQLVLHLQILYNGLHHQVCAVDHGRCIRAGRYAAQGLRHKLVSTLVPWRKEKRTVTGLTGKWLMRCKGGRKQEGEDRPEYPRQPERALKFREIKLSTSLLRVDGISMYFWTLGQEPVCERPQVLVSTLPCVSHNLLGS